MTRILCAAAIALLSACATPDRVPAVPPGDTTRAVVSGIPMARFWMDVDFETLAAGLSIIIARERADLAARGEPTDVLPPAEFLAISGGGEDGAFGAGLLVGWTETGTRPEFKVVTGISTGALTAPFAFLGPDYDDELEAIYTEITADNIFALRGVTAAIFDDALADTSPLRATIARYADADLLARIAEEYARGRILLIGTTDIDARQSVVWNIGAIAESGHPGALDLFHDILLASAAIPGAFPPVLIDVEVDGVPYQEMHVDGGAVSQVFAYPPSASTENIAERGLTRDRTLYVIRNARLDAEWASTERQTLSIASRAISTLIQSQGVGDIYRIYTLAQRDGVEFNLAYIGADFDTPLPEPFDPGYMRALFDYGYDWALAGPDWHRTPPDF